MSDHRELIHRLEEALPAARWVVLMAGNGGRHPLAELLRDSADALRAYDDLLRRLHHETEWWRGRQWGDQGLRLHVSTLLTLIDDALLRVRRHQEEHT
jgi:hypothetical protein